jgi:hypothetical protein
MIPLVNFAAVAPLSTDDLLSLRVVILDELLLSTRFGVMGQHFCICDKGTSIVPDPRESLTLTWLPESVYPELVSHRFGG